MRIVKTINKDKRYNYVFKCVKSKNTFEYKTLHQEEVNGYIQDYFYEDNKLNVCITEKYRFDDGRYIGMSEFYDFNVVSIREYENEKAAIDAKNDLNTLEKLRTGKLSYELTESELERLKALYAEELL